MSELGCLMTRGSRKTSCRRVLMSVIGALATSAVHPGTDVSLRRTNRRNGPTTEVGGKNAKAAGGRSGSPASRRPSKRCSMSSWCAFRRSRPLIPTDRDQLFRSIATNAARVLRAPLDDGGDVSLLWVGQARREAVPVVNRRGLRVPRSAHTADAAARAGGPC